MEFDLSTEFMIISMEVQYLCWIANHSRSSLSYRVDSCTGCHSKFHHSCTNDQTCSSCIYQHYDHYQDNRFDLPFPPLQWTTIFFSSFILGMIPFEVTFRSSDRRFLEFQNMIGRLPARIDMEDGIHLSLMGQWMNSIEASVILRLSSMMTQYEFLKSGIPIISNSDCLTRVTSTSVFCCRKTSISALNCSTLFEITVNLDDGSSYFCPEPINLHVERTGHIDIPIIAEYALSKKST